MFAWISGPSGPKWQFFGGKIGEGVVRVRHWPPSEFVPSFGRCYFCATFGENQSIHCSAQICVKSAIKSKRSIALTITLPCCLKVVVNERELFFACSGARRASWLQDGTEVLHVGVSVWPCVGILQPGTDACHGNWGVEKLSYGNRGFCSSSFRFLQMFDFKILLCFL